MTEAPLKALAEKWRGDAQACRELADDEFDARKERALRVAALNRDTCAAELEALLSVSPQENGWQDISTAPKDGTQILAFDEGLILVTQWVELEGVDGWWDSGKIDPPPTHWMPLPAPPVIAEHDKAKK